MTAAITTKRVAIGTPQGARARIGLIGLASGMTTERDMHRIIAQEGVLLVSTRVADNNSVTLADLKDMEADLARAAGTILPGEHLDVIAYGCTSGAIAIGEAAVERCIAAVRGHVRVTNQFRSAVSALNALKASRISLVSPYTHDVTEQMRRHLQGQGLEVLHAVAFGLQRGNEICSVDEETVLAETLAADLPEVEGLFICCGGLRTLAILEQAERQLKKPVVSSNQSLAWHALRLAGIDDPVHGYGRLLLTPLPSASQPGRNMRQARGS
jgi:maleate isomerase